MDFINRARSTLTNAVQQGVVTVMGNPVIRECEMGEQIGTAGPALMWKVYKAKKKSSKQPVALWVFEKKSIEGWKKDDQIAFVELLKRGVGQLTRVRHPRVLVVEQPLEEHGQILAFCTEPIFGSLANILGDHNNLPHSAIQTHKDYNLQDVEIKLGLKQVAEALAFMHSSNMLHRNVCPESVILNERGDFKLAGFDFVMTGTLGASSQASFDCGDIDIDRRATWQLQPNISFMAPECIKERKCDLYADIYSLGAFTHALLNCEKMKSYSIKSSIIRKIALTGTAEECSNVPHELRDDFKLCLNKSASLRPDAAQFTKFNYFNDNRLHTIHTLESLMQFDNTHKMKIFKELPNSLASIHKRLLFQKVRPCLVNEFATPEMVPFVLPSIFFIMELCENDEFTEFMLPGLIPVFRMRKPYQIVLLLLDKMDLILTKANSEDVQLYVLPLLYESIGNDTTRIQELCLQTLPQIAKLISTQNMKVEVLPKLLHLIVEGPVVSTRVKALLCLSKLLSFLDEWMVSDQIFPAMLKIDSKEPGLLMAILGILQLVFKNFNVSYEHWARKGLPYLVATSVQPSLNLEQYNIFTDLIHKVMAKVEEDHRKKWKTLSAEQQAVRSGNVTTSSFLPCTMSPSTASIVDVFSPSLMDNPKLCSVESSKSGVLSLEEKKRLAAQQESIISKPSTANNSVRSITSTSKPSMNSIGLMTNSNRTTGISIPSNSFGDFSMNSMTSNAKPLAPLKTSSSSNFSLDSLDPFSSINLNSSSGQESKTMGQSTGSLAHSIQNIIPPPPKNSATNNIFIGQGLPQPPRSSNTSVNQMNKSSKSAAFGDLMSYYNAPGPSNTLNISSASNPMSGLDPFASLQPMSKSDTIPW